MLLFLLITSKIISQQVVYITQTGKKYHRENCRFLKYSRKETTIKKAKEFGYLTCKICKPTVYNTKAKKRKKSNSIVERKKIKNKPRKKATATQCTGKTKSGRRCRRKTKNSNGRCYQH